MKTMPCTVFVGDIVTMNAACPRAEAVCVINGRIACVGSKDAVIGYASAGDAAIVNLPKGTLYPGFIDTHSHLAEFSDVFDQVYCGASLGSTEGVLDALRRKSATLAPGEWVLGYGYDDTGTPAMHHLTCQELDTACPDHPVFVKHISIHLAYANTLALKRLQISHDTRVPGGEVVLDAHGKPTGLLTENVAFEAFAKLPKLSSAQRKEHIVKAIAQYNRQGFTSVMDGGLGIFGDPLQYVPSYMELDRARQLNARIWLQAVEPTMSTWETLGLYGGVGSEYVRFGGAKRYTDGSIQGYTAALQEDYHSRPGFRGSYANSPEETQALILHYHKKGIQVAVHTNGDAAIESTIQAFEKAYAQVPCKDRHHMLVHAQMASDEQLARMKAIGLLPTFFALHIDVWGDRHQAIFLGPDRAARLNPAGTCVRLGLPFSLHMDTPVLPPTALHSMHVAVNRVSSGGKLLGADQRISPLEALKAYTVYAALFCGGERDRGQIEPGRFGDFVLLSENLEQAHPEHIREIQVLMTVCGGKIVYQR